MPTMSIGLGALKPQKIKAMSKGMKDFAKQGKFGLRRGNKISVPKAMASKTHSS